MKFLKEIFKGFSVKKLLLCILCSIILATFIGFTVIFVEEVPSYTLTEILSEVDDNSEIVKEYGNSMQEQYKLTEEDFKEQKEIYGEEYPAEGIFLTKLVNVFRSSEICRVYILTLLIGIVLGTFVYIIFIQKAQGIQMLLETTICGISIIIILALINLGYSSIVNMAINKIGTGTENVKYITYVYDIEESSVLYGFIGIIGVSYIINLIYQKILTKKFNKKLNKR